MFFIKIHSAACVGRNKFKMNIAQVPKKLAKDILLFVTPLASVTLKPSVSFRSYQPSNKSLNLKKKKKIWTEVLFHATKYSHWNISLEGKFFSMLDHYTLNGKGFAFQQVKSSVGHYWLSETRKRFPNFTLRAESCSFSWEQELKTQSLTVRFKDLAMLALRKANRF